MISVISVGVQSKQWALEQISVQWDKGVMSVTTAWWDVSHSWVSSLSANVHV